MRGALSIVVISILLVTPVSLAISCLHPVVYNAGPVDVPQVLPPDLPDARPSLPEGPFVENLGQMDDEEAVFIASGRDVTVVLGRGWVAYQVHATVPSGRSEVTVFRVVFEGAARTDPIGREPSAYRESYLLGNDPEEWYIGARSFWRACFEGLYPGIDLEFSFKDGVLKYEYIVHPGGDPCLIRQRYIGIEGLSIDDAGNLVIETPAGPIKDAHPTSFHRMGDAKTAVESRFVIDRDDGVGFCLGNYDANEPLVIDPSVTFGTYIGGSGNEYAFGFCIDDSGYRYITGQTISSDFPTTPDAYDRTYGGNSNPDLYVVKLNITGKDLIYSTYLGGSGWEVGWSIEVDDAGCAHVTGATSSANYPVSNGSFDPTYSGNNDVFVTKLNAKGTEILYSTYVGGSGSDEGYDIVIGANGTAFVVGETRSSDFPTTPGAFDRSRQQVEGFIFHLNESGTGLVFSSLIGGSYWDWAQTLTLDSSGNPVVCGITNSGNFPRTPDAFDTRFNSATEMFVLKMNVSGDKLIFSTFLSDGRDNLATAVTIGPDGSIFVAGMTDSSRAPTTSGAYDTTHNGDVDGVVYKLNHNGSQLLYGTYIGGRGEDWPRGIAIGDNGTVYVCGHTDSEDFPMTRDAISKHFYYEEYFLVKLNSTGSRLLHSTFIGGTRNEFPAFALSKDDSDRVHMAGLTRSSDFPVSTGAFDTTLTGGRDAFIAHTSELLDPWFGTSKLPVRGTTGDPLPVNVTVSDNVGVHSVWMEYWYHNESDRTSIPFTRTSGTSLSGTWQGNITPPPHSLQTIQYSICAKDRTGNINETLSVNLSITDNDPPTVEDRTADHPTTGDTYEFTIWTEDNIGISNVSLEFFIDNASWNSTVVVMEPKDIIDMNNGTYVYDGYVAPLHNLPNVTYRFIVEDASGNVLTTNYTRTLVVDNDEPHDILDGSDKVAFTGDTFYVNVTAFDNIEVTGVRVLLWHGSGALPTWDIPMVRVGTEPTGNGTYVLDNFTAPLNSLLPLRYRISVTDAGGNRNLTGFVMIDVFDNDAPVLIEDLTGPLATTGDPVEFVVRIQDNIGVQEASVVYWSGRNGSDPTTSVMQASNTTPTGNGTYTLRSANLSANSLEAFHYYFVLKDIFGNVLRSVNTTLEVLDDDPPVFVADNSDTRATTGDVFKVLVSLRDNIAVGDAYLVYWFGQNGRSQSNVSLEAVDIDAGGNGTYCHRDLLVPLVSLDVLNYHFTFVDGSGNWNRTQVREIRVHDNDPPIIRWDPVPERATTGDDLHITVDIEDNILLTEVNVTFWFGDSDAMTLNLSGPSQTELVNGTYWIDIPVPKDSTDPLNYLITAADGSGNVAVSDRLLVPVEDDDVPTITTLSFPIQAVKGLTLPVEAEVEDNIGIELVTLTYMFEGSTWVDVTLGGIGRISYELAIPRDSPKALSYYLTATDAHGNVAKSDITTCELVNTPPVVSVPIRWEVTEGVMESLDLLPLLDDPNDPVDHLMLNCSEPNVIAKGQTLIALYPDWRVDHFIRVTVDDGETPVGFDVLVHVININGPPDYPMITSPTDGSRVLVGESVTFDGEFNDPDTVEGQMITVVWTSNVSGELSRETGTSFTGFSTDDLPIGTHRITVTVSDGTYERSASVLLVVEPLPPKVEPRVDEGWSDYVLLALLFIAIVLLVIVLFIWKDGRFKS